MSQKNHSAVVATNDVLQEIKKTAIVAMFADDELMNILVLKGGNAMDIVHQVNSRASIDLDFSTSEELDVVSIQPKIEKALKNTFELEGNLVFDIKMTIRPGRMPEELSAFWGGYYVEFKLISLTRAEEIGYEVEKMRREAIRLGEGTKFTVDISRHEYIADKQQHEINGYSIFVYSPEMIVCEKLRAICQQMPDYGPIIQRSGSGKERARDFIDIEALVKKFGIDITTNQTKYMLEQMFAAKKVPMDLIHKIKNTKSFHSLGFETVRGTMKPGVKIKSFEFYFEFVVEQCARLESFGDIQPPPTVV